MIELAPKAILGELSEGMLLDLGHADGAGVILRFRLERAKIFSLEFLNG